MTLHVGNYLQLERTDLQLTREDVALEFTQYAAAASEWGERKRYTKHHIAALENSSWLGVADLAWFVHALRGSGSRISLEFCSKHNREAEFESKFPKTKAKPKPKGKAHRKTGPKICGTKPGGVGEALMYARLSLGLNRRKLAERLDSHYETITWRERREHIREDALLAYLQQLKDLEAKFDWNEIVSRNQKGMKPATTNGVEDEYDATTRRDCEADSKRRMDH